MKIDLRKLYTLGNIPISGDVIIPEETFKPMDVIKMDPVSVLGDASVDFEDNICVKFNARGTFYMTCAVSLEEVPVNFDINIDETISESSLNDKVYLDLLEVLWENIVLEIPVRVVKEGIELEDLQGEGWEARY